MDITLHPDDIGIHLNEPRRLCGFHCHEWIGCHLHATELKTGITVNLVLTPELQKKLAPLQEEEKKKIADEAFERGVEEGRSCQAILEIQGRDRFIAEQKAKNG